MLHHCIVPRRPLSPPFQTQIEDYSSKLFRLLLEYDRDEEGNFRESVHAYFERVVKEIDRQSRIQELQSQLNHMDITLTLQRIQELQNNDRAALQVVPELPEAKEE